LNVIFLILFKHEKAVTFTATASVVFPFITLQLPFNPFLTLFYTDDTDLILERLTSK
jgi:hypothetical protein